MRPRAAPEPTVGPDPRWGRQALMARVAGRGAPARSDTGWSRSGTARPATTMGPRTPHRNATPAEGSPGPGPGMVDRAEHPVAVRQQLAPQGLGEPNELLAICHRRSRLAVRAILYQQRPAGPWQRIGNRMTWSTRRGSAPPARGGSCHRWRRAPVV